MPPMASHSPLRALSTLRSSSSPLFATSSQPSFIARSRPLHASTSTSAFPYSPSSPPSRRYISTSPARQESKFGPPNPTANNPPAHPLNENPRGNHGAAKPAYKPPSNPNARANGPYKPSGGSSGQSYKLASRRITLALVAAPIALVTSWAMWDRVVMGRDKRKLVGTGPSGERT